MHALQGMGIKNAYFISPIVNMQNLIEKMMSQAHVSEEELWDKSDASEEELRDKSEPNAEFKEKFSWKYLCYAKKHPACRTAPTYILYGKKDHPSSFETICEFAQIRSAQCLPSEKRGASVLHSWANAIFRRLDMALYPTRRSAEI